MQIVKRSAAGACLALLLLGIALATGYAAPVADAQSEAEPVTLRALQSGEEPYEKWLDADRETKITLKEETQVQFQAEAAVHALYFVLDQPAEYSLTLPDEKQKQLGQNGFLHEYVSLESGVAQFAVTFPAGATICDVYAFGQGNAPDWVQRWQPACERADLLVLPTHADDEHLWFGGTMPYYAAERGLRVQVVYMTGHWDEPYRPHELLDGLWTVGIRNYPVISDLADKVASKKDLEAAREVYGEGFTQFQVQMLRRFKPSVVVGHDLDGEYGHGAHQLNAVSLVQALELAADESYDPESVEQYGVWDTPKTYLHLYEENEIVMPWDEMPLESFDGKTAMEVAKEGYACHLSQQKYSFAVRGEGSKYDCRKFGLVRTTVGEDEEKNDFFEHIDLTQPDPGEALPEVSSQAPTSSAGVDAASMPDRSTEAGTSSTSGQAEDAGIGLGIVVAVCGIAAIVILVMAAIVTRRRRRK